MLRFPTYRVGILGRGFGLYGYLPALLSCGLEVVLPPAAGDVLKSRPELTQLTRLVTFVDSEGELLSGVNALVVARTPAAQSVVLERDDLPEGIHLFLEKPLALGVAAWNSAIKIASDRGRTFSVGYLFPYTSWYPVVLEWIHASKGPKRIDLSWRLPQINAHIHAGNWKQSRREGAGPLAYYLVHLAPLLRELNLNVKSTCENADSAAFTAAGFVGGRAIELCAQVSGGNPCFRVGCLADDEPGFIHESVTPFGGVTYSGQKDVRIPYLAAYIRRTLTHRVAARQRAIDIEDKAMAIAGLASASAAEQK